MLLHDKLIELLLEMNDDICQFNEDDNEYLCNGITNSNGKYCDTDKINLC